MRLEGRDTRIELFLHMSVEDLISSNAGSRLRCGSSGVARAPDLNEGPGVHHFGRSSSRW